MESIIIRNFLMSDLDQSTDLFLKHTFHLKYKTSTPERIAKNLYLHSILNVPLSSLGLDIFTGSVAIVEGKRIVGAIIARRFPLGKTWVIGPVAVHKEFRRLQIATKMMSSLIADLKTKKAKSAILSVERNNLKGRAFFGKFGFNYLGPSFTIHSKARNYARISALIHGYLRNPSYKIEQHPSRTRNDNLPGLKKIRMWYIMLKEF